MESCDEYRNFRCDERTQGRSNHQLVCLETDVPFAIQVIVEDTFNWADANGLCFQVDFDSGARVANNEVFLLRDNSTDIKSAISLRSDVPGTAPKAVIRNLTQLIKPSKKLASALSEESMCFKTVMLSDERGKASGSIRRHGQICVGVSRCKMEKRIDQHRLLPIPTKAAYPTLQKLKEAGIYSRIAYTDVEQRPSTNIDIRVISRIDVATYTFLYRVPDQFDRIVKADETSDESDSIPEQATSPLFEPEEESISRPPFLKASSPNSFEASIIIVKSPTLSAANTAGISPPPVSPPEVGPTPLPVPPTALTIRDALQMQADYETKVNIYERSKMNLEADYLAEEKRWGDLITGLERESQNQEAEHEKRMQALQYEYNSLQAKIARQQQEFNADKKMLEEKIHHNKRVSEIFDEGVQKRTKLTRGNA